MGQGRRGSLCTVRIAAAPADKAAQNSGHCECATFERRALSLQWSDWGEGAADRVKNRSCKHPKFCTTDRNSSFAGYFVLHKSDAKVHSFARTFATLGAS